jgi:thiosulfate reductase cytochrome b subunit
MSNNARRTVLRWIHLLAGLPLIGFVYGPSAETEPYRYMFQYVFMPVLLLSGLLMWKGHLLSRLFSRQSTHD